MDPTEHEPPWIDVTLISREDNSDHPEQNKSTDQDPRVPTPAPEMQPESEDHPHLQPKEPLAPS